MATARPQTAPGEGRWQVSALAVGGQRRRLPCQQGGSHGALPPSFGLACLVEGAPSGVGLIAEDVVT